MLRELVSPEIPDKILRAAYNEAKISFAIPLEACSFGSSPLGQMKCDVRDTEGVVMKVAAATLADHGFESADLYEGVMKSLRIETHFAQSLNFGAFSINWNFYLFLNPNSPSDSRLKNLELDLGKEKVLNHSV